MADAARLEEDGIYFAKLAVQSDKAKQFDQAKFYYMEAAQALFSAKLSGSEKPNLVDKANEYILRCEVLNSLTSEAQTSLKSNMQTESERAEFLVRQAFEEDELGHVDMAVELYLQAAELCIELKKKNHGDRLFVSKVDKLALNAISRAEELKKIPAVSCRQGNSVPTKFLPLGDSLKDPPIKTPNTSTAAQSYSKDEIAVLRQTSSINGREYVPFMAVDINERFAFPIPFNDPHGKLHLSSKQKQSFRGWVRPEQFISEPQMILAVSSFSVKQTIVSDCSFVASLAISAQYERKFNTRLITSIIYPQNKQGIPVYNPCGKYMVKMHINGVPRKVVIDDWLPMGTDGQLLCSFSNNKSELWVSLLEKAYMKVMGGYDFPGSNSNIDMHALTGWIPERVAIRSTAVPFDKDKEFQKILTRFHRGDCLVTVATGDLLEANAERAGLVPSHAYALLDIRELLGKRLLMLKNPWSHLRWKGRFSENDLENWTPALREALNFNPKSAQQIDNGVFWIDYDSFCAFFECIYINWKPDLFKFTTCIHHTWTAKEGPVKDVYSYSDNPQYRLELRNPSGSPAAVWILLTRHITDKDDFADNKEFITFFVYTGGARVYYPSDPPPYRDGVKINSPHYLCKMVESGSQSFTLVISQYEKLNTIHYTLRVFAQCEFSLSKIIDPYKHEREIPGEWKGVTAGGCGNHPSTHRLNPIYQVGMDNNGTDNSLLIELRAPRQYSIGLEVIPVSLTIANAPGNQRELSSGAYRKGYCVLRLDSISGGVYNIMASTYQPQQEGPFVLKIYSKSPISLSRLQ